MPAPNKRTEPYVEVKTLYGRRAGPGEPLAFVRSHVGHVGDDCLIWPYGRYTNGYCAIIYEGVQTFAHRVMCRLAHGEPEYEDLEASHTCNKGHEGCINPRHLVWETHVENHSRRIGVKRKPGTNWGGGARGERNRHAKLSEAEVRAIKADTRVYREIARDYGVSLSTIKHIRGGFTWGHVK